MLSDKDAQNILKIMNACYKRLEDIKGKVNIATNNEFILKGSFTPEQLRRIAEVMEMYKELMKSFKIPEDYEKDL